jgi:hypothetical protein
MIRSAALFAVIFVAVFATLSLLDYIGTTFGAFWVWVLIIGAAGAFTAYAEHHERRDK